MSLGRLDLLARHVEEPVDLFRIVKSAAHGAPGVLGSLRCNYDRDAPPRGLEKEAALIHHGLSMFVSFDPPGPSGGPPSTEPRGPACGWPGAWWNQTRRTVAVGCGRA
jgi:hypothetical protein